MSATTGVGRGEAIAGAGSAARAVPAPSAARRNAGLDALRAALTLLVLFHHTAITYGAIGGWYYHEAEPDRAPGTLLLILFCTVNQAFFMGAFFLIAGYFTPGAAERHGAWAYLRERALRLGVPILAFCLFIGPLTIVLATRANPAPAAAVAQIVKELSLGERLLVYGRLGLFAVGPLWFPAALLVFSFVYVAWHALASRLPALRRPAAARPFPSNITLAVAALATGAVAFALRLAFPLGVESLGPAFGYFSTDLGYFASYIVLFAAGCIGAAAGWLDAALAAQRRLWLIVALCAMPVWPAIGLLAPHVPALQGDAGGGWNIQAVIYAFYEPLVAWGLILGLLHAFQRRFASLGPIGSALARRAYAIYIIHPPVLVAVALAWRHVEAPHLVKFAVTGSATCLACFWLAGLLLRAPWIRRIV